MTLGIYQDVSDFEQAFQVLDKDKRDTIEQQFGRLKAFEMVPKLFEDSTHHIFKLFFDNNYSPMICKLCLYQSTTQDYCLSPELNLSSHAFWCQVKQLFDFDACKSLDYAGFNYEWFRKNSVYKVANLYGSGKPEKPAKSGFLLQEYIEGVNCHRSFYTAQRAQILAKHLLSMHQNTFASFGPIPEASVNPEGCNPVEKWWQSIVEVLQEIPAGMVPECEKQSVIAQVQDLAKLPIRFVPQLLDFRWDQIRWGRPAAELIEGKKGQFYLLDLDALLVAPLEFDWLMLELVLSADDMAILTKAYNQGVSMPLVAKHREVYRMVFFAMNLLGEMSWDTFKNQPQTIN